MKYIIANLKSSLNDNSINNYLNVIDKIKYEKLIICPQKKYINYFKDKFNVGSQDYYDDIKVDYCIIGHYEKKNTKEEIKEKIKTALNNNIKVILCVGNDNYNNLDMIKEQLEEYLVDIKKIDNIFIAYEPYFMINTNNEIDFKQVEKCIKYIKNYFNNNMKVFYGGNVNMTSATKLLDLCDGILLARAIYNPHNLTNILNKITKKI